MQVNATKFYNGLKYIVDVDDRLIEIYDASEASPWPVGMFSSFEYKEELNDLLNKLYEHISESGGLEVALERCRTNLCNQMSDFAADYFYVSNEDYASMSGSDLEEYSGVVNYTNKALARELKRHADNYHDLEISDKALDAYFILNDEEYVNLSEEERLAKMTNFKDSVEQYKNMEWWEKAAHNTGAFLGGTVESVIDVGEGLFDAFVYYEGKYISAISFGLIDDQWAENIISYKASETFYDWYADSLNLNDYVKNGKFHTAGNQGGDILSYYLLANVPVFGKVLTAAAGFGQAIEDSINRQKENGGEVNDWIVLGEGALGLLGGLGKGNIYKNITNNAINIILNPKQALSLLKNIKISDLWNIIKNDVKSLPFVIDATSTLLHQGSEAYSEYQNTGEINYARRAWSFLCELGLARTLDKVASDNYEEFYNPKTVKATVNDIKGFFKNIFGKEKSKIVNVTDVAGRVDMASNDIDFNDPSSYNKFMDSLSPEERSSVRNDYFVGQYGNAFEGRFSANGGFSKIKDLNTYENVSIDTIYNDLVKRKLINSNEVKLDELKELFKKDGTVIIEGNNLSLNKEEAIKRTMVDLYEVGSGGGNTVNKLFDRFGLSLDTPSPGTLNTLESRVWYLKSEQTVPNLLNKYIEDNPTVTLKDQAEFCFNQRNELRREARDAMSDNIMREYLNSTENHSSFEEFAKYKKGKIEQDIVDGKRKPIEVTDEVVYEDIIGSSTKSRDLLNRLLGIVKEK